jgi:crotonobetainyl-CoA:carnitine CoA-transferase CaiB-like acyl-CoA transferase
MNVFEDIQVLELGRVFSAPLCGMVLADVGARVVKVERPGVGDESRRFGQHSAGGNSCYFNALNRNKQSVALDLKRGDDREAFIRLIGDSDVLVHNWLQHSLDKLGFGYNDIKKLNPKMIYCSISGYGHGTAHSHLPSQDILAQAVSGLMSLTGEEGGMPLKTGIPVVDYVTGLNAAFAIMSALYMRQVTGEGQLVTTSLLESALAMTSFEASSLLSLGVSSERRGNRHPYICPYNVYQTKDDLVTIAVANDAMWERFCVALGLGRLLGDARFATNKSRLENQDSLELVLESEINKLTTARLIALLKESRVSCARVNSIEEAFESDPVRELDMIISFTPGENAAGEKVACVGKAFHLEKLLDVVDTAPPVLGSGSVGIPDE